MIAVLDNEGSGRLNANSILDVLVTDRLLARRFEVADLDGPHSPVGGMVWSPCFEDADFSLDLLLEAWQGAIQETKSANERVKTPALSELRRAVEEKKCLFDQENVPSSKNTWIKAIEEARSLLGVPLHKPQLAAHLARLCAKRSVDVPIVRLIHVALLVAHKVTHYGPPLPYGGYGGPIA